jgi:HAD superfamily hydrolase (TIGR01509 family)
MTFDETGALPGQIKAVVFDMDGLLFDSERLYGDAFLAAAAELGHPFGFDDFLKLVGGPWPVNQVTLQEHVGSAADVEVFRATWMRHYESIKGTVPLKTGVIEMLQWLDEFRLPRAICTSSSHADVSHNLTMHDLDGRFDAIVAWGDYARGKPSPDPFLRAAELLGEAAGNCVALEDSHNGVRAAAAAGMRTIMVVDLLPPTEEIHALCFLVARDLHEVRLKLRV